MSKSVSTELSRSPSAASTLGDLAPKVALPVNGLVNLDGADHIVERRVNDRWQLLSFENEPLFLTDREVLTAMPQTTLEASS